MSILDEKFNLSAGSACDAIEIDEVSDNDIAIIGIAARLPKANNVCEVWDILRNGSDCTGHFPETRRNDIDKYIRYINPEEGNIKYSLGAYLDDIDKFDNAFFGLSTKESSFMDPRQRLFLQAAWSAIEDAGYGGEKLVGSRTGVYVGFSDSLPYQSMISSMEPEMLALSAAGNINSIIASRISYFLDFKGPSMLVDTACSSSLVAVHLACQAIRNNECDAAIAGGVRICLAPMESVKLGIESSDGRTKTFDDSSDGTGLGEGVVAMLLKPLSKAVHDRDNIYAVIKGVAVNQDGTSVGITAPNVLSQEDVIERAWRDANIDPETIRYIEAHGTGTKLGDPIEVEAITNAFSRYTNKKQFCAIGSIKTNIGHLDSASGIAGLLKAVLALKYKCIPTSNHFCKPNSRIRFEDSPVYVNDTLRYWEEDDFPRRCGVSSFGLSGTNCHVVIEEPPHIRSDHSGEDKYRIFTLSAKNDKSFKNMISRFISFLECCDDINHADMCYTMNTGRGHYKYRLAIICKDRHQLLERLKSTNTVPANTPLNDVYIGEHEVIAGGKVHSRSGGITENRKKVLDSKAKLLLDREDINEYKILQQICTLYIEGADIDFERLYAGEKRKRVSLPTYSFNEKRCWLDIDKHSVFGQTGNAIHQLIDKCVVESVHQDIYLTRFSVDKHWVINEHKILGSYFPPGTVFLEMARAVAERYYPDSCIEFRDILFLKPLIVEKNEIKEVQTIISKHGEYLSFIIASRDRTYQLDRDIWTVHAEGKIFRLDNANISKLDIDSLKTRCNKDLEENINIFGNPQKKSGGDYVFGKRFTTISKHIRLGTDELFAELTLADEYDMDLKEYYLHPFMLDLSLIPFDKNIGNDTYLPISYDSFSVYGRIPKKLYCYCRKADKEIKSNEIFKFNITLAKPDGSIIGDIRGFAVKKVNEAKFKLDNYQKADLCYKLEWKCDEFENSATEGNSKTVVAFCSESITCGNIVQEIRKSGSKVIEVHIGREYKAVNSRYYLVRNTLEDYCRLFRDIYEENVNQIVHLLSLRENDISLDNHELKKCLEVGVYSLNRIIKALVGSDLPAGSIDMAIVTDFADSVTGSEPAIKPYNAALFGLATVIEHEHANITCKCIDIDRETYPGYVAAEILSGKKVQKSAYRENNRYVQELQVADLDPVKTDEVLIKENGVYLITGGTGGIGLTLSRYLARTKGVRLVLIGRSKLPEKSRWGEYTAYHTDKLAVRLKALEELEGMGACVDYYSADVSNQDEMARILDEVRRKYGVINGIIHGAGVPGGGLIYNRTEDNFTEVLLAKIHGTWILHDLVKDDNPDFFILHSSITSIIGGIGQGDYAAANAFLDSFSSFRNSMGKRTLVINWAAWKDVGMAAEHGVKDDGIFKFIS